MNTYYNLSPELEQFLKYEEQMQKENRQKMNPQPQPLASWCADIFDVVAPSISKGGSMSQILQAAGVVGGAALTTAAMLIPGTAPVAAMVAGGVALARLFSGNEKNDTNNTSQKFSFFGRPTSENVQPMSPEFGA